MTTPNPLVEVRFFNREAVTTAGPVVADVAGALGIDLEGRTQLQALTVELVRAVLEDSFREGEPVDLRLIVGQRSGELTLELEHHGAPTSFRRGKLPPRIDALVALGFADTLEVGSSGIDGNRALIRKALPQTSLTDDARFTAETSSDEPPADPTTEPIDVRVMTPDDVVGVARLYFRTYGYTKLLTPYVYDPDLFTDLLQSGRHLAAVATTSSGRIVGHIGLTREADGRQVGCADTLAVEPAFRQRGLVALLTPTFAQHLVSHDVRGVYGEAVTMHTASQRVALQNGATETGVLLGRQPPEVALEGFDAVDKRRALILMYQRLIPLAAAHVYVPPAYANVVGSIYGHAGIDRTLSEGSTRHQTDLPPETVFNIEFWSQLKTARICVVEYGADFLKVLQDLFHRLDRDGYELNLLELPLSDPGTAHFGSGLSELGVCFNGVMPDDAGDQLLLARCVGDLDIDAIAVASEFGTELRDFVVGDYKHVAAQEDMRARTRASMARIYEAL
jgi:hypothetical protein